MDREDPKRNLPKHMKIMNHHPSMDHLALVVSRMMEVQARWDEETRGERSQTDSPGSIQE